LYLFSCYFKNATQNERLFAWQDSFSNSKKKTLQQLVNCVTRSCCNNNGLHNNNSNNGLNKNIKNNNNGLNNSTNNPLYANSTNNPLNANNTNDSLNANNTNDPLNSNNNPINDNSGLSNNNVSNATIVYFDKPDEPENVFNATAESIAAANANSLNKV
jgi:hypothetical protein